MNDSVIYMILNNINNKIYIGSAINFYKRKADHISKLNKNKHSNKHLQFAWIKYNNSFTFYPIELINDINKLIEREQYWIDILKPEYNIAKIAGSNLGMKHTKETKLKQSLANKGNTYCLGYKHTENTKKKMSLALKNNKRNLGKQLSKEHKDKISQSNIGRKVSDETKKKLSEAAKKQHQRNKFKP